MAKLRKKLKYLIKQIVPPILLKLLKIKRSSTYWVGNFNSWDEAKNHSTGYDQDKIINKVFDSTMQVIAEKAAFEKDSMLFLESKLNPDFFAAFSYACSISPDLSIIDFGGALGSTYWQHRKLLKNFNIKDWKIVEQERFIKVSKPIIEASSVLSFHSSLEEANTNPEKTFFMSSATIQYLNNPYEVLEKIVNEKFQFLFLDRVAFNFFEDDKITIQKVHMPIYEATYPAWFLNENKFLSFISERYDMVFEFQGRDVANLPSYYKGFLFERKS